MESIQLSTLALVTEISPRVLAAAGWAFQPENKENLLRIAWLVVIVALLIGTAIAVLVSTFLLGGPKWGVFASAVAWAFFFGGGILFFLPARAVATVFGGCLGITVDHSIAGRAVAVLGPFGYSQKAPFGETARIREIVNALPGVQYASLGPGRQPFGGSHGPRPGAPLL